MDNSVQIESLKKKLISALSQSIVDFDQVLELSTQIAQADPDYVRFSIDAGHIARLGRELVGRQETAVSELIKNAFDADATEVDLVFENADKPGGTLTIEDNGSGMGREQIVAGFMRISSQEKVREPTSPRYKRMRAGRKGIGRFAAQRLGRELTIITQTVEASTAYQVIIDWEQFQGNLDLSRIRNQITPIPKQKLEGTTLIIKGLHEAWSERAIKQVYRYISELIQPYPISERIFESSADPGFQAKLFRADGVERVEIASIEKLVFDLALAEINAHVDLQGRAFWSLNSKSLSINEQSVPFGKERNTLEAFSFLRDVHLRAYYYIYDKDVLPRAQINFLREIAAERAGIRLYRNGFRVLPYGEEFNDWLNLDKRYGQRSVLIPIANRQWFGFVEVHDPNGSLFEETSSREGLLENEAYNELVHFASTALISAAERIGAARQRKTRTNRPSNTQRDKSAAQRARDAAAQLADLASQLDAEKPSDKGTEQPPPDDSSLDPSSVETGKDALPGGVSDVKEVAESIRTMAAELQAVVEEQEATQAQLLDEINLLRVLGSLGLTISEFVHEVGSLMPALEGASKTLRESLSREPKSQLARTAANHEQNILALKTFTGYFRQTVRAISQRDIRPQELGVVARNFHKAVQRAVQRYGIVFETPEIQGFDLYTRPMHESEWTSILFNLFTNSRKAIYRKRPKRGQIHMAVGRNGNTVYVEFSDNGDGIKTEDQDHIFDAFWTTSIPAGPLATYEEEAVGSGLGLKIVRDIVDSYQGDIQLVSPPSGYATCFRVEFPVASNEELDQYDL